MNQAIQSIIMEYGIKKLRYSLITFDSLQDLRLKFSTKFGSKFNTANFVNNLRYTKPTGDPNLHEALSKAKQQFNILKGHRVDAQKVVVVLIDKLSVSSKEDLQRVVDEYKRDKIKIVPVLIGDEVSTSDVVLIASDKDKKNIVVTATQERTERLGKMIMDLVYKVLQDPCLKKVCQFFSQCVKKADNAVTCECPSGCKNDYKPVCGSDKRTYTNNCTRMVAACTSKTDIGVLKNGACAACTHPLSLVFVIGRGNFQEKKLFMKAVVEEFNVGKDSLQLAIISYDNMNYVDMAFDEKLSKKQISDAIDGLQEKFLIGEKYSKALLKAGELLDGVKRDTVKAIVVITDKEDPSTSDVALAGKTLKDKKIKVFSVGVGSQVSSPQLKKAVSQVDYHNGVPSFSELVPFAPTMARQLCTESELLIKRPTDLAFAVSATGVQASLIYKHMIDAIKIIITKYRLNRIRYGFIEFANRPNPQIQFTHDFGSLETLLRYITVIPSSTGQPNIEKALISAGKMFSDPLKRRVLVVMVDRSTAENMDDIIRAAKELEMSGIKVIPIVLGPTADRDQLTKLTSNPNNVIDKPLVKDPKDTAEKIMEKVLKDPCKNVQCQFHAKCVTKADDTYACECDTSCPSEVSYVCGKDGNMYMNECHLRMKSCMNKKEIGVKNKGICETTLDLGFAIGASGINSERYFSLMKEMVNTVVDMYTVSPQETRVGLVDYNDPVSTPVLFSRNYNKQSFKALVNSFSKGAKGSLAEGLRKAREELFSKMNGNRPLAQDVLVVMTVGDYDESSPEIKDEVQKLRDMSVKVVVIALGLPPRNKLDKIASGVDLIVSPRPDNENEKSKEIPSHIAREYRSCADVQAAGFKEDGHYLLQLSDSCRDSIRVYCDNMSTGSPKEYITLPSGPQNNYAIIYDKRLQLRYDCDGDETGQVYAESGTTNFQRVRLLLKPLSIHDSDFTFSTTASGKQIAYGTAGDCYSVQSDCRKGSFKIDLTGTGLRMKDTVSWIHQGFPKRQRIQDLNKTSDGLIASAKCGGYCGRCKPKDGVITLEPVCLLPAACPIPMDVVFALDSSELVSKEDFQKQKEFAIFIINTFTISATHTRVSVLLHSASRPTKVFDLNELVDLKSLSRRVDLIQQDSFPATSTRITKTLKEASKILKGSSREGVPKVVIIIVHGDISEDIKTTADSLKADNIKVFSIGVGKDSPVGVLQKISTSPRDAYMIDTSDELSSLSVKLAKETCTDPCFEANCQHNSICITSSDAKVACVCPDLKDCPSAKSPVCGTDGINYDNDCKLRVSSCKQRKEVSVSNLGPCDACVTFECGNHSRCEMVDNSPRCVCKDIRECSSGLNPVCGSDGSTYISRCHLEVENCQKGTEIMAIREGMCDPCFNVVCEDNKQCVVRGGKPNCACQSELDCPLTVDTVCGSDDKSYINECVMKARACMKDAMVTVKQRGYCGACILNNPCKHNAQCVSKYDGTTSCRCRKDSECPSHKDEDAICASDGKTYASTCMMDAAACPQKITLTVKHRGRCGSCKPDQCDNYSVCVGRLDGTSSCVCPKRIDCPQEKNPVCGTDGQTYSNECEMKAHACANKKSTRVQYPGKCGPCFGVSCSSGTHCVTIVEGVTKRAECRCPLDESCARDFEPVCGSNRKTYVNKCHMRVDACNTATSINLVKQGSCDPCQPSNCKYNSKCELKADGSTECVCPDMKDCSSVGSPVCGSDGRTYDNGCKLKAENCAKKRNVMVVHEGNCRPCSLATCSTINGTCVEDPPGSGSTKCQCTPAESCSQSSKPVCGANGKSYQTKCHLAAEACTTQTPIALRSDGPCDACAMVKCLYNANCKVTNRGTVQCVCSSVCPPVYKPVCGSNGVTYQNECFAKKESCDKQFQLSISPGICGVVTKPCSARQCSYAAKCVQTGNSLECHCPEEADCPEKASPVCGYDGKVTKTYKSKCLMEVESCSRKVDINIVRYGECASCAKVTCKFYGRCVATLAGSTSCVCPDKKSCPRTVNIVCGSDGRSYLNECNMRARSCRIKQSITVSRQGYCNICHMVRCPKNTHCFAKPGGDYECRCPKVAECSSVGPQACGSDGRTYDNKCKLIAEACRQEQIGLPPTLTAIRDGNCESCDGVHCKDNKVCKLSNRRVSCVCPDPSYCDKKPDLICGSDGKEYANECLLKVAACQKNIGLKVASKGKCGGGCAIHKCRMYATCHESPNRSPVCVCPRRKNCPTDIRPVCGSDGKSYINICFLRVISCWTKKVITKTKDGACDPCRLVACKYYGKCQAGQRGGTRCICPSTCQSTPQPVCGSDLQTYNNECQMKVKSCNSQKEIRVLHKGPCSPCTDHKCHPNQDCFVENNKPICKCPKCDDKSDKPLCGNDRKTHLSKCMLRLEACSTGKDLYKLKEGACDPCSYKKCGEFERCTITPDNIPECLCPAITECKVISQVCGSDGTTYASQCHLKVMNCLKNRRIRVKHAGQCGVISNPCSLTRCPYNGRCDDSSGQVICSCPQLKDCPRDNNPVCGSDLISYRNKCYMVALNCPKKHQVYVKYNGYCAACAFAQCYRIFAKCVTTRYKTAKCVCPTLNDCSFLTGDVCGSNIKTYKSECHLRVDACTTNKALTVLKRGRCETCKTKTCQHYSTCKMVDSSPKCICPKSEDCSKETSPVCGSDDKDYANLCQLKVRSCSLRVSITVKNQGVCDRGDSVGFLNGNGYLKYASLPGKNSQTSISMVFRPTSQSGVLLFSMQGTGSLKKFDYIVILLRRGFVVLSYDLGKGSVQIQTTTKVNLNNWNRLIITRNGEAGTINLNGVSVSGSARKGLTGLNVDQGLYLGGIPIKIPAKLSKLMQTTAGFMGCIRELRINKAVMGLKRLVPAQPFGPIEARSQVDGCVYHKCMMMGCLNGASCAELSGAAFCRCPYGFIGQRCEKRTEVPYLSSKAFIALQSFIKLRNPVSKSQKSKVEGLSFKIKPEADNGVIFYTGASDGKADFMSLAMRNGKLEYRFSGGKGVQILTSATPLRLNQPARVQLIRNRGTLTMIVNGVRYTKTFKGWFTLDLNSISTLGLATEGVYGSAKLLLKAQNDTGLTVSFKGCIQDFTVEDPSLRSRAIDLSSTNRFVQAIGTKKCGCRDQACLFGGQCVERSTDFRCDCKVGYTGPRCEVEACGKIKVDVGIAIDGSNSVDKKEYRSVLDFVIDLIKVFPISEEESRVGILEYGSNATIKINFDEFFDRGRLITAVNQLKQQGSTVTRITDGIKKAIELFDESAGHGARGDDVQKVFIFFTDGYEEGSFEELQKAANTLKSKKNMKVIAVGVDRISPQQIETIASSIDNAFKLRRFEELGPVIAKIRPVVKCIQNQR